MKCPNQIHKYRRFRGTRIFRCIRPGCSHFVNRNFVIGRLAECWACGDTFVMSEKSLQMKPTCGCRSAAKKIATKPADAEDIVNTILSKVGGL